MPKAAYFVVMSLQDIQDPQTLRRLLDAVLLIEKDLSLHKILEALVAESCGLVSAKYGALGVLDNDTDTLSDFITYGMSPAQVESVGQHPTGKGLLGHLIIDPSPLRLADIESHPKSIGFPKFHPRMKSFLGIPVAVGGKIFGNLYLTDKLDGTEFTVIDEIALSYLATAAAIAIENSRLHDQVALYATQKDRERIARELHDEIIQRLFAIGLTMQSTLRMIEDVEVGNTIQSAIDDLDNAIKTIRTTIFALELSPEKTISGFRSQVFSLVTEMQSALGLGVSTTFDGLVDSKVTGDLALNAMSVIREGLSNIAKHTKSRTATLDITVTDTFSIIIEDNGIHRSASPNSTSRGLRNMADRADVLGGHFKFGPAKRLKGSRLEWSVPL